MIRKYGIPISCYGMGSEMLKWCQSPIHFGTPCASSSYSISQGISEVAQKVGKSLWGHQQAEDAEDHTFGGPIHPRSDDHPTTPNFVELAEGKIQVKPCYLTIAAVIIMMASYASCSFSLQCRPSSMNSHQFQIRLAICQDIQDIKGPATNPSCFEQQNGMGDPGPLAILGPWPLAPGLVWKELFKILARMAWEVVGTKPGGLSPHQKGRTVEVDHQNEELTINMKHSTIKRRGWWTLTITGMILEVSKWPVSWIANPCRWGRLGDNPVTLRPSVL